MAGDNTMPVKPAPNFDPASLAPRPDASMVTIEHSLRFLTYMFGGGVEVNGPEKPHDRVTPIRVASIRGQLRFWWRACNPGLAKSVAELRTKEAEIWGSTSMPSSVVITVTQQPGTHTPIEVYGLDRGRWAYLRGCGEIAYGAFPLKPGERDKGRSPGTLSKFEVPEFKLAIRLPSDHRPGIEEALTAWSLFGGLGGRTRRGFGAVEHCNNTSTIEAAQDFLNKLKDRTTPPGVPSLIGATLASSNKFVSAIDAWTNALGLLQSFRQGRSIGRRPGEGQRPGRSYWPEAEELRLQTRSRAPKHGELKNHVRKFPRAAFGLPIIFHFHPGTAGEPESRGDPADETLNPVGLNRFASPLIIRPIRKDHHFLAFALRLTGTTVPDSLELSPPPLYPADTRSHLTKAEAQGILPMSLGRSDDVIEAFLNHFTQPSQPPKNRR